MGSLTRGLDIDITEWWRGFNGQRTEGLISFSKNEMEEPSILVCIKRSLCQAPREGSWGLSGVSRIDLYIDWYTASERVVFISNYLDCKRHSLSA